MNSFKNFAKLLPDFIIDRVDDHDRQSIRWGFPNGYGASLVCHPMSYSGEPEFAALKENQICYDTPITRGIVSSVTEHEVAGYLARLRGM